MTPITLMEKIRAFDRVKSSASSLIHDRVLSENEFKVIIDRAVELFGHPVENRKKLGDDECHTQDHQNGERST